MHTVRQFYQSEKFIEKIREDNEGRKTKGGGGREENKITKDNSFHQAACPCPIVDGRHAVLSSSDVPFKKKKKKPNHNAAARL